MIYKVISSKVCISRVIENFNIDYSGFIPRVPTYVTDAMKEMRIIQNMTIEKASVTITNYKGELPTDMYQIAGVAYFGFRIPRVDRLNETIVDNMPTLIHPEYKYQLDKAGNIIPTFEEGELDVYYYKLPVEFDTTTRLWFPNIPDDIEVLNALDWYILMKIMRRGHNVPGYSFSDNNPFTNPAIAWEKGKQKAINSVGRLDNEDRKQLSDIMLNFIQDKNSYYVQDFNPSSL